MCIVVCVPILLGKMEDRISNAGVIFDSVVGRGEVLAHIGI
jgi:hypothetical protein